MFLRQSEQSSNRSLNYFCHTGHTLRHHCFSHFVEFLSHPLHFLQSLLLTGDCLAHIHILQMISTLLQILVEIFGLDLLLQLLKSLFEFPVFIIVHQFSSLFELVTQSIEFITDPLLLFCQCLTVSTLLLCSFQEILLHLFHLFRDGECFLDTLFFFNIFQQVESVLQFTVELLHREFEVFHRFQKFIPIHIFHCSPHLLHHILHSFVSYLIHQLLDPFHLFQRLLRQRGIILKFLQ